MSRASARLIALSRFAPALLVVAAWHRPARGEPKWYEPDEPTDPYALPDAPAPPTLPDLTHRALSASLETTFARMVVRPSDASSTSAATGLVERVEFEQALAMRRWYLGFSEEVAGSSAAGGFLWIAGQPEIWGRAVWASRAGLAYGGGLGLVAPLFDHGDAGTRTADSVRVVRPWDEVQFLDHAWSLRPFIDVREIDGPIILQFRQGLDWAISTGDSSGARDPVSAALDGATQLTTRTAFFLGYRPLAFLGLGLEFWEVYVIQPAELHRATYAVSPGVRFMTPFLQPALSFLAPIDKPMVGSVDSYWAVRLSLGIVIDPSRAVGRGEETSMGQ